MINFKRSALKMMLVLVLMLSMVCCAGSRKLSIVQEKSGSSIVQADTDMKHYESTEWKFALDIPKNWTPSPPVPTNSPNEVIRFGSYEDGFHNLIIFRLARDPKQSLNEHIDNLQKVLANAGFGNFVTTETAIGSKKTLILDFDMPRGNGLWSVRYYFVTKGTLQYTLGFGTTNKDAMFELYDRVAKSFKILAESITTNVKHYESLDGNFALDIPGRWNAFPPNPNNSPYEVIRFSSNEGGNHLLIIFQLPHNPNQSLKDHCEQTRQLLTNGGFGNFVTGEMTIGSKPAVTLDFDMIRGAGTWSCCDYFIPAERGLQYMLGFGTTNKKGMLELFNRTAQSFEILLKPTTADIKHENDAEEKLPSAVKKEERIKALIATVNSDDHNRVREFLSKHCTESFKNAVPMSQHLDVFKRIYQESGGMDLKDIRDSDSGRKNETMIITKGRSKGNWSVNLYFEETDDLLLAGIMFGIIPEPPEGQSERYLEKVYRSKLDNTQQPYIVKLPENYDKQKKYPLIVYLHGSGVNEKSIYTVPYFFPDDFFGLSVNGRGPFTDYCYNNAQDDIAETIAEVVKAYSIDQENIIISGTSMGGFGVFRTFYETPEKFKAIASFSGLPKGKIAGPEQPNFLEAESLKNFKGLYIFIFHQTSDPLCPYEMVEKSVKIYQEHGAFVEFYPENATGHGNPGKKAITAYHEWLRKIINQKKHQNKK